MNRSNDTPQPGTLYVVATPIGNREDITLRALKILGAVDLIAAEDTRKTRRFLALHDIRNNLVSYHEHNETERTPKLIAKLKEKGMSIALVSNAGTPAVSDPGYRLIEAAGANGLTVVPIPGVSAVTAALSVAGLPTDAFVFTGFPAKKKVKRLKQLGELAGEPRTLVLFESPKRIISLLQEVIDIMGDRRGVLSREITKRHEEIIRGRLSGIMQALKDRADIKGECTLLVAAAGENSSTRWETIQSELHRTLKADDDSLSQVAKKIARKYKIPKNKVYEEALRVRRQQEER